MKQMRKSDKFTRDQLAILDNPASASKMRCYLCGCRIGDREYLSNADGLPFHYECPTASEIEAKVEADMKAAAKSRLQPDQSMLTKPPVISTWLWLDDHNYPDLKLWQDCLVAAYNASAKNVTEAATKMYARLH